MANVAVLNTDAGTLSGKTLVNAESSQTITGAKTFDLDPNPPFVVSSGSAVVPNLDADKVDGADYSTATYVPTYSGTLGNGTITGRYTKMGNVVKFRLSLTWGNSTSHAASAQTFTLPVTALESAGPVGAVYMVDSGTAVFTGVGVLASATTVSIINSDGSQAGAITNTTPFTWTTNDIVYINGWYHTA